MKATFCALFLLVCSGCVLGNSSYTGNDGTTIERRGFTFASKTDLAHLAANQELGTNGTYRSSVGVDGLSAQAQIQDFVKGIQAIGSLVSPAITPPATATQPVQEKGPGLNLSEERLAILNSILDAAESNRPGPNEGE